jgi:hypothetical protein
VLTPDLGKPRTHQELPAQKVNTGIRIEQNDHKGGGSDLEIPACISLNISPVVLESFHAPKDSQNWRLISSAPELSDAGSRKVITTK